MAIYDLIIQSKEGDSAAREQIITENYGLIYMILGRFKNRGVETEDLFQLATIGLLKAINNFDCSLNLQFSTYAVPMMMGEIRRYLRDNGPIKVSRSYKNLSVKAAAIRELLLKEKGHEPTVSEIASTLKVDVSELSAALSATKAPDSLDEIRGDSALALKDIIPAEDREERLVDKLALRQIVEALPKREKIILYLRYQKDKTQAQVAEKLGISQVQVSRLEKKIIETIRKQL